ncbi:MAG: PKD domain-containing protein, partial [Thermoplasmata archaeon]|nr:PKD domain-containing protein [Thermoplasmata archaeon]
YISGMRSEETIISGQGSCAFIVIGENVEMHHLGIRDCWNDAGIYVFGNNATVSYCNIYDNYYGIYLDTANSAFEKSAVHDNSFIGILFKYTQQSRVRNCTIFGNNIGMVLDNSNYNRIEKNTFSDNYVNALKISYSHNNIIYYNDFRNNFIGCYLENSADNLIYFSNFIGNTQHVIDYGANMWDNGSVGNYWDDYDGVDTNWDGIGDTPYEIDANSIDHYPLIREAGFPIAYFTWQPSSPYTFETVYFYDASIDLDGAIVSWLWNFGDGNISYEKNPTHYYADDGIYIVNLTVTDNDGRMAWMEKEITVLNTPPVANFTWQPQNPTDVDEIIFNASLSYDIDGFIANYTWNFGDGWMAYGKEVKHVYADNGNYTVNLTIIDDDGATAYVTKVITVRNVPPVANFLFKPYEPTDLDTIEFTDKSYDLDGNIVNYTWNFGDGNISYEKNPTHQYKNNGLYVVSLTVVDDDDTVSQISKAILVKNVPPVVNFTWQPQNPTDLETITFTSTSYDPDGYIVNYTWSFGNGNKSYETNATWKYADDGLYVVTLTVIDDDSAKTIMEKEINVSNVPPKALFTVKPTKPRQDEKVVFNASTSYDPDGHIVNYTWDFQSDGIVDAYGLEVTYKYEKKGNYFVTLTIVDDDGASDSMQILVNVREKEKVPGFEFIIIIAASAILILMKRQRRGIWRI